MAGRPLPGFKSGSGGMQATWEKGPVGGVSVVPAIWRLRESTVIIHRGPKWVRHLEYIAQCTWRHSPTQVQMRTSTLAGSHRRTHTFATCALHCATCWVLAGSDHIRDWIRDQFACMGKGETQHAGCKLSIITESTRAGRAKGAQVARGGEVQRLRAVRLTAADGTL